MHYLHVVHIYNKNTLDKNCSNTSVSSVITTVRALCDRGNLQIVHGCLKAPLPRDGLQGPHLLWVYGVLSRFRLSERVVIYVINVLWWNICNLLRFIAYQIMTTFATLRIQNLSEAWCWMCILCCLGIIYSWYGWCYSCKIVPVWLLKCWAFLYVEVYTGLVQMYSVNIITDNKDLNEHSISFSLIKLKALIQSETFLIESMIMNIHMT